MNNVSYTSHLESTATNEFPLVILDNAQNISGTMPEDFNTGNNMEHGHPATQLKTSEIHLDEASLLSSYQPVNKSSIVPVHQLLF